MKNPKRILVIEDNRENLALITYLLRANQYVPLTATDGADGLNVAKLGNVDAVLCDIHMPGLSGFEVASEFKRDPDLQGIPLIALTAYAMVGDREKILSYGFDMYIPKPIIPETFIAEIEGFLTSRSNPQSTEV